MKSSQPKLSDRRLFIGVVPLLLSRILFVVALAQVMVALVPPIAQMPARIYIGLLAAFLLSLVAGVTFKDKSTIWHVWLESLAIAGVGVGASLLIRALLSDWHVLFSPIGIAGTLWLSIGLVAAASMKYFQGLSRSRRRT